MYKGIGASKGYGIGRAVIYKEADLKYEKSPAATRRSRRNALKRLSKHSFPETRLCIKRRLKPPEMRPPRS